MNVVTPSIYSRTIPVMFQSDLQAKLVTAFSPLIGLPVSWVAHHRADAERMAQEFLEERHSAENMRARAETNPGISPRPPAPRPHARRISGGSSRASS